MNALTIEQRETLKEELEAISAAAKPLLAVIEPLQRALRQVDAIRDATLERYGVIGEVTECEHCKALIVPGDRYAHYEDGPIHCEACAPSYQDSLDQQREIAADETADPDERADAQEAVLLLEQRTPEELKMKILTVWE